MPSHSSTPRHNPSSPVSEWSNMRHVAPARASACVVRWTGMGVDVFIVHASTDKGHARRLSDSLETMNVRGFLDERDAEAGKPWGVHIQRSLRESLLQVVLLGSNDRWYQSEEIAVAIDRMRRIGVDDRIIPVL